MKYDELIKALREHSEYDYYSGYSINPKKQLMIEAADAIEELTDRNVGKWIPVTERLPGMGEVVLVYGKRGGIYTAEHNRNGRWPGSFWKLNSKSHYCEPTHWMPLPEPPKDGE